MFGNQPRFKYYLLVMDTIVIIVSVLLAGEGVVFFPLLYILFFSLLSLLFNDLYKRNIVYTRYRQTILIIKSMVIAVFVSFAVMVILQYGFFVGAGRVFLLKYFIVSIFLLLSTRVCFAYTIIRYMSEKGYFNTNILIVGADKAGLHVAHTLETDRVFNFNIVGFVDDYKEIGVKINDRHENLGKLENLGTLVKSKKINEILIAIDGLPYSRLIKVTDQCLKTGIVVRIYSNFLDVIIKKINVEYYAGLPVVMLQKQSQKAYLWKIKRGIDVTASGVALILLSPVFLFVAIGIKLSSKGPVIFKQTRIGRNGKPFDFYKFRSMHLNTDSTDHKAYVQNFIKADSCDTIESMKVFKITNDPRIFPFGHFIRKTSIDEFPQFFNVIKGDMSLIGPRPCLPYEWECYDEWHRNRLNILPGCTGLWQVLGRSSVTFEEMVVLDLYYISNLNFFLLIDLKIVLQTIPVIFFGKGGF
jgi:exopolysaccharide biosynthesis polyprenyl glycosylphosphotransferase